MSRKITIEEFRQFLSQKDPSDFLRELINTRPQIRRKFNVDEIEPRELGAFLRADQVFVNVEDNGTIDLYDNDGIKFLMIKGDQIIGIDGNERMTFIIPERNEEDFKKFLDICEFLAEAEIVRPEKE